MAPVDRSELAREWAGALAQVVYVARSRDAIERALGEALDGVLDVLRAERFTAAPAASVAERLVGLGLNSPDCVGCSIDVLGRKLPRLAELSDIEDAGERVASVLSALARGFTEGMRKRLFDEQEGLTKALIRARENAERALEDSEARFEEIFSTSSVGMAISDLDGTLIRTNRALGEILGHRRAKVGAGKLAELFHPEDAEYLRLRYQVLLDEDSLPFRERRRLVRADGEEALVYLSASVLRDPDGTPRYFVTSAEDVSDKHFLEGQLQFQATHDALTGLVNRRRFTGRLEEALRGKDAADEVTVFHLDLDGFRAVNNGLGRDAGDRLLHEVGLRLREAFVGEAATIARFDGDEFGVLLEHGPDTPEIATFATRINEDLAEPVYIGDEGVATTASIAVMHRPDADSVPAELLRATDTTLARLKASGRRQWAPVDEVANEADRARFTTASAIAGGWESGELDLDYRPVVSIVDGRVAGMQALLHWDSPKRGRLGHEECLDALAETGLTLPIGRWLLGRACAQVRSWTDRLGGDVPALYVELTKDLAGDPDLVSTVQAVLADADLPPALLRLGMPVQALCMTDGVAEDNLDVLVDLGVEVVLYEFGTTRGDLACLEDLRVSSVKLAARVVSRVDRAGDSALFTRAIRQLVPLVREAGTPVVVGGVETAAQLDWWRAVGVDFAQGDAVGVAGPPQEAEQVFVA